MKLMPALPESIFDIAYLIFAIWTGVTLLRKANGSRLIHLMGLAALTLGCGDAFHLVPRVLNYWIPGDWTAALGIGKLVTSITMTVFYLFLEGIRRERYRLAGQKNVLWLMAGLGAVRLFLCAFPQNAWTSADAPVSWGVYRNIPFVIMGALTVYLWLRSAGDDQIFRHMWLAVLLSFLFYIPVVLWAHVWPMTGMLMLPKTLMYIWMLLMFRKAAKEIAVNR